MQRWSGRSEKERFASSAGKLIAGGEEGRGGEGRGGVDAQEGGMRIPRTMRRCARRVRVECKYRPTDNARSILFHLPPPPLPPAHGFLLSHRILAVQTSRLRSLRRYFQSTGHRGTARKLERKPRSVLACPHPPPPHPTPSTRRKEVKPG